MPRPVAGLAATYLVRVFAVFGGQYTNIGGGPIYNLHLTPGTYILEVGSADRHLGGPLSYQLRITLGTSFENAVSLTVGAAPPYAIARPRTNTGRVTG